MIHLSPPAVREIRRLSLKQASSNKFFRVRVQTGGCSGLFYDMMFDEAVGIDDRVYDCTGISVVVDACSLNHINGLSVDYSEDLMGGGFRFHNPNAIESCGCGNSFSIKIDHLF